MPAADELTDLERSIGLSIKIAALDHRQKEYSTRQRNDLTQITRKIMASWRISRLYASFNATSDAITRISSIGSAATQESTVQVGF